jgi:peptidoglycan/xylan/chitin deacetylase (PgdA/CDA1 family)
VIGWLDGRQSLPPYAALITFDDGYLDNYANAYPILRQHNFPAAVYLTSGHIDTDAPFYWDLAAYCFFHTKADHILFPDDTEHFWKDSVERGEVSRSWIESMKALAETQKQDWVSRLPGRLDVSIPHNFFRKLMMNWDQVREMYGTGIEFGGHTVNHPILSRISLDQAKMEIEGSKTDIEREIGQTIFSFAYPNGRQADLNSALENLIKQAGYRTAFTLINGPTSLQEVKRNPFAIRRIFIGNSHTLPQFATLVNPLNRYRS